MSTALDHEQDCHSGHHGHHVHAPVDFNRAFAVTVALNAALVATQVFYGVVGNSMALLADAGHNFGDVLALLLAWAAHGVAQWRPTRRYTYGFRSASILAALFNSLILLIATGAIALEAVRRLLQPGVVATATVMIVAAGAIVVNGLSAWMLAAGRKADLNIRAAILHLVGDAAVSMGVVAVAAAM